MIYRTHFSSLQWGRRELKPIHIFIYPVTSPRILARCSDITHNLSNVLFPKVARFTKCPDQIIDPGAAPNAALLQP